MNKWILSRAWCLGHDVEKMECDTPSIHDSEEDAVAKMMEWIEYDLADTKYHIVIDEREGGFYRYFDKNTHQLIAFVCSSYADIDAYSLHARYIITEVEG